MKVRLLSDIHQEFFEDKALYESQGEDVLVLAGDINVGAKKTIGSLFKFYENQKNIIYVPGNHEYYGTSAHEFDYDIRVATRDTSISFLNPGYCSFNGVTFIGAALWTNFRKDGMAKFTCARNINDFRLIKGFDTDYCDYLHTEQIAFIKEAYEKLPDKKVIVTHFLPAVECISPQYRGPDLLNYYFASDYGDWIADLKDTTWLFGHTHDNVDIMLGDTRLIANPYGYHQNRNYKEMIIDV